MSVADAEDVGDDTVSCTAADVGVHGFFADAKRRRGVGVVCPEVGEDGATVFSADGGEGGRGDELDGARGGGGGEDAIGCELEVEVLFEEEVVH